VEYVIAKVLAKELHWKESATQAAFIARFKTNTGKSNNANLGKEKKKKKDHKKCDNCRKKHPGECWKPKSDSKYEKLDKNKPTEASAKVAHKLKYLLANQFSYLWLGSSWNVVKFSRSGLSILEYHMLWAPIKSGLQHTTVSKSQWRSGWATIAISPLKEKGESTLN
jgi:hypothetical protein